jgi:Ser/Thr protein kinase RdoA (MazF antagonist)
MLAEIADIYSEHVLAEFTRRFGVRMEEARPLDSLRSYVYELTRDGKPCILKITHTVHRSEENLLDEVDFLRFLADHGVRIPRPVPFLTGRDVECLPAERGDFLAYAFERAEGALIARREWTPKLIEDWGALMGRIHAVGRPYQPRHGSRRPLWHWNEFDYFERHLSTSTPTVRKRAADLLERLGTLPTGSQVFGLIHGDLHPWNIFQHQGELTPFDFDDCVYDWFLGDLAGAMYYAIADQAEAYAAGDHDAWTSSRPMDRPAFFKYLRTHLLAGYRREHPIDEEWVVNQLPDFLLRSTILDLIETLRLQAADAPEDAFRTVAALTEEIEGDRWRDARLWS